MFEPIGIKKSSLLMNLNARRNSYSIGFTIQSNMDTNLSLNEIKKQTFQNDVLSY